jgi:hypothetical protein
MSILIAALISFFSVSLLLSHLSQTAVRRIVGYCGWVDLLLHGTVIYMFMGTSTLGLIQAEASAIMFSLSLRLYRWMRGYERLTWNGWKRYAGRLA